MPFWEVKPCQLTPAASPRQVIRRRAAHRSAYATRTAHVQLSERKSAASFLVISDAVDAWRVEAPSAPLRGTRPRALFDFSAESPRRRTDKRAPLQQRWRYMFASPARSGSAAPFLPTLSGVPSITRAARIRRNRSFSPHRQHDRDGIVIIERRSTIGSAAVYAVT